MRTQCPTCGESYKSLGMHWRWNSDHIVSLSDHQQQILRGILASDGWFGTTSRCVQIENKKQDYLEHISNELGWLGGDVTLRNGRDDIYSMNTVSHPEIAKMEDRWVIDGNKLWPADMDLTPTVLSHLYAGDGHRKKMGSGRSAIVISCASQAGRKDIVYDMFRRVGFEPLRWSQYKDKRTGNDIINLVFSCDTSDTMVEYMNEMPGYEYKWWSP